MVSQEYKKNYLEELRAIARSHGGECLSEAYIDRLSKLTFQCHKGHIWQTTATAIKHARAWCPICRYEKSRYSLDDLHDIAAKHGGKCLATEYKLMRTKVEWQCAKGHVWKASGSQVRHGSWCKQCADNRMRLTIEQMHKLAHSKGGRCLSTHYTNNETKLLWQCQLGHTWYATPSHVKHSSWCPLCNHLSRCKHDKAKHKYLPQNQKK